MLPRSLPKQIKQAGLVTIAIAIARHGLFTFWSWLRDVSEDGAYDRYKRAVDGGASPARLTPAQFYLDRLANKYSKPCRCC